MAAYGVHVFPLEGEARRRCSAGTGRRRRNTRHAARVSAAGPGQRIFPAACECYPPPREVVSHALLPPPAESH